MLFATGLGIYFQGNFLNLKTGVLNGADIQWSDYRGHILINTLVWVFILVAVIFFALQKTKWFDKISTYAALFLGAIQLVSLIFMMIPVITSGQASNEQQTFVSDEGLCSVGDENIVVFILDMFDDEYMREILAYEPELTEELKGFTYFPNFSGSYSTTAYSIAHLATGQLCYNEEPLKEWVQSVTEEGSYLDGLTDEGYQTYLFTQQYYLFPDRIQKQSINFSDASLKIKGYKSFTYNLYQLVACKYFPDFFKAYFWMDGTEFDTLKATDSGCLPYESKNTTFMEQMYKKGMSLETGTKQFKFIHLDGAHYPYYNDAACQKVARGTVSAEQCARGSLQCVLDYIDLLKQKGVYDSTAIIITADHGYSWDGSLTSPTFLVKPMNATDNCKINEAPACQTEFASTILELAGINQQHKYGDSVFDIKEDSNRERFHYKYYLSETGKDSRYRLLEYRVDNQGNTFEHFHMTDVEYTVNGDKIQHSMYCKTCKENGFQADYDEEPSEIIHYKDSNYPSD